MNYQGIQKCSLVNGEGVRTVLWVSGCSHRCKGCHNQETWDIHSGKYFNEDTMKELLDCLEKPYIDGLTFSGGDPMHPANSAKVTQIAKRVKFITCKSIWMYTGYKFEEIKDDPILGYLDVIVDGEYKEELRDENYKWAGSTNQRIWKKVGDVWEIS